MLKDSNGKVVSRVFPKVELQLRAHFWPSIGAKMVNDAMARFNAPKAEIDKHVSAYLMIVDGMLHEFTLDQIRNLSHVEITDLVLDMFFTNVGLTVEMDLAPQWVPILSTVITIQLSGIIQHHRTLEAFQDSQIASTGIAYTLERSKN